MEGRFGYVVLTARYFYVTALVHLTKDFDDLIYSVSFLFHDSGRVLARQSLIFNGPVYGGQVTDSLQKVRKRIFKTRVGIVGVFVEKIRDAYEGPRTFT